VSEGVRLPHLTIGLLGIVTICVYGSWYYSFGVLLDPIIADTGWSETTLAASFSAGIVLIGSGAMFGGRLLDRLGTRPIFLAAAGVGMVTFGTASIADHALVFAAGSAIGMGAFGALGFYHITMTAAVRAAPHDAARAIAVLTIWGALASAIYLPSAAWLVEDHGWRVTMRVLVLTGALGLVTSASVAPVGAGTTDGRAGRSLRSIAASTVDRPGPRAFTLAVALAGMAISTLLVYQVPIMVAAGLPLTTAASMAAVRGFAQLGGRLPLTPLLHLVGSRFALMISFGAIGTGVLILTVAGSVPVALLFAVIAGFGIGAYSPLQGIYAEELFDRETLGATMGFYTSVMMLAGAIGPAVAGAVADATGERRWASVLMAAATAGAIALMTQAPRVRSRTRSRHAAGGADAEP
jgi:MFS family permease